MMYLKPDAILKYMIGNDEKIDTIISCGPGGGSGSSNLVTTDHALYEALGSLKDYDSFNWRRLVKFLESVKVISYQNVHKREKPILTEERVDELRKLALEKNGEVVKNGTGSES